MRPARSLPEAPLLLGPGEPLRMERLRLDSSLPSLPKPSVRPSQAFMAQLRPPGAQLGPQILSLTQGVAGWMQVALRSSLGFGAEPEDVSSDLLTSHAGSVSAAAASAPLRLQGEPAQAQIISPYTGHSRRRRCVRSPSMQQPGCMSRYERWIAAEITGSICHQS